MRRIKYRKVSVILSVLTMLSYLSIFISPAVFWPIGLINYAIPLLLFSLLFLIVLGAAKRKHRRSLWLPVLTLILGYYFIDVSFNFPRFSSDEEPQFSVLSYNTHYFRKRRNYGKFQGTTITWAAKEASDIKCFQEFSTFPDVDSTDVISKMEQNGYSYHVFSEDTGQNNRGLAIFSKFPIIDKGVILLNPGSHNNCIYIDALIRNDTIRIYNFHLKSMNLRLGEFKYVRKFSDKSKDTVTKLGSASSKRAVELDKIIESLQSCPYPYILACDFNELVYGNNYYKIRKEAKDSFEEAGSGFGFTFNSILFFIRIDHQFFSDGLQAQNFKVIKDVKSSDHYPVKGWYRIDK